MKVVFQQLFGYQPIRTPKRYARLTDVVAKKEALRVDWAAVAVVGVSYVIPPR
jgi:hypothetical protein